MPGFADIARVARGEEAVLDWREVMALPPEAHRKAIGVAARHVWLWMSAQARQDDKEFHPAQMVMTAQGKPAFKDVGGPEGRDGWRWDGVGGDVYVVLWPSLNGKINGRPDPKDPDVQLATSFRGKVSRYLRAAGNVVNVHAGGARGIHGQFETPQWFIAAEYDPSPPSPSYETKGTLRRAGYDGEDAVDQRARKLTSAQAGEDKAPGPVVIRYTCRRGCAQSFAAEPLRDAHERTAHRQPATQAPRPLPPGLLFKPPAAVKATAPPAPASAPAPEAAVPVRGGKPEAESSRVATPCRVCGKVLSSRGNRNAHEKNMHPAEAEKLYVYLCLYPGCDDRFDEVRGLSIHLGAAGHGLKEGAAHALRDRAVELAEAASAAAGKPEKSAGTPAVAPAAAHATTPKKPVVGSKEALDAYQAASNELHDAEREAEVSDTQIEAYVRRLMTADNRAQKAEAEARRLGEELKERDRKLAGLRKLLGEDG